MQLTSCNVQKFFGSANRGINKKYLYYYDSIESAYDIISNILAEYNIEENVFTKESLMNIIFLNLKFAQRILLIKE